MSRGSSTFRQRDVTAAIKAVVAAGVEVGRVEVTNEKIIVFASKGGVRPADDLDQELAEFEARHGEG